jgi:hypothetical protein
MRSSKSCSLALLPPSTFVAAAAAERSDVQREPLSLVHDVAPIGGWEVEPPLRVAPDQFDEAYVGLSQAEALKREVPEERYLVDDLVPAAAVGTVAGVPETHKSFLAQKISLGVAAGTGEVLGRPVASQGPVGYFWQDDSEREELERIKLYESIHPTPDPKALPIHWFLNMGVQLPRDLGRVLATIEQHSLVLVTLDSFYNFVPELDLKDQGPEQLVALLKREIADTTGCTVLIVDHMPWATDTNRSRLRAYGGVFKNAATRFGIYIDAQGSKLYIEARGNNIRGFKKTPAYWDADALELRLVEVTHEAEESVNAAVLEYVEAHPGDATSKVAAAVGKRRETVEKSLERHQEAGRVTSKSSRDLGRPGTGRYWFPLDHAESEASAPFGTGQDGSALNPFQEGDSSQPSAPRRGDGSPDGSLGTGQERLEAIAVEKGLT